MVFNDSQATAATAIQMDTQAHQLVRGGMLSEDLDLSALADQFAADGIVQIEHVLRPEVADLLHECLAENVPWSLAYRNESGPHKLWSEELAAMDSASRAALDEEINAIARRQFQFRYDSFMMVTAYKEKRHPELVLHRVIEQINSPEWLDAFRTITGFQQIRRADAQATRYMPGHFLRKHNDLNEDHGRLCAYVINLSRDWQADWGGLLQILDDKGEVVRTLMPRFNSISLFRVPTEHCVSPVAAFANGARYAITGWFRT